MLAPPPSGLGVEKIPLPGRHPMLPIIYRASTHVLVEPPHGNIYIGVLDFDRAAMNRLFNVAASLVPPDTEEEVDAQGMQHFLRRKIDL